ncbi:hypothetical protein [Peptostreptococcus porci]|uniref:hypothetical protein n=1 Tax=Peptostreptococcus porci TaxID=2652282 RepID=UPI002A7F4E11|nr:hypothetical protein [Peptostreptococcus porci]MDY4127456.1 hypothetical protein [Peptostreptococcus porci]MDY5435396.1 hypothetical protein [Peptostreptococcus porci]
MSKATKTLMMFIALFSIVTSSGTLAYKLVFNPKMPWFVIIGGLFCGLVLTYLVKSYDSDDDFMPKNK